MRRSLITRRTLSCTSRGIINQTRPWFISSRFYSSQGPERPSEQPSKDPVADALRDGSAAASSLLAPVHIPEDAEGVLQSNHPANSILSNPSIIVHRQLEMMNVLLGFEQANKYAVLNPEGAHIGYMAEQELGMGNMMARQWLRTHRAFQTHVFDRGGREVLRFHRPFQMINSTIRVFDPVDPQAESAQRSPGASGTAISEQEYMAQPSTLSLDEMTPIGQAQQQWSPLRRKYNLFLHRATRLDENDQRVPTENGLEYFAYINSPFLSWDFALQSTYAENALVGSVNRNFSGFGRELFTDMGVYALRMDAAYAEAEQRLAEQMQAANKGPSEQEERKVELMPKEGPGMTLDERAVMLATAVSVDFDYFSNRGGGGFGRMWPFYMGGVPAEGAAGAAGGAAAGEAAAGAGALEGVGAGAAGSVARGAAAGIPESAAVGAGTIAGYEAMQRGRSSQVDDASSQAPTWQEQQADAERRQYQDEAGVENQDRASAEQDQPQQERNWWEDDDDQNNGGGGGGDGGEGGGSIFDFFSD